MAKSERIVYGGVTIREHEYVDNRIPEVGVREMMFIGFPVSLERTPMWLRMNIPIDHSIDGNLVNTSAVLRQRIVDEGILNFWDHPSLRHQFWNFWRQWTNSAIRFALRPNQFQEIQSNLHDIVNTLRPAYFYLRDPEEETPLDFLNHLQITLEEPMSSLSRAININDVDGIVRRAPSLQDHWQNMQRRLKPVKKWAQRKYVGEALGLSSFEPAMIKAAEEANDFLKRLNQVLALYAKWKDGVSGSRRLRRPVRF